MDTPQLTCNQFQQNLWKPTLCTNCYNTKDKHENVNQSSTSKPQVSEVKQQVVQQPKVTPVIVKKDEVKKDVLVTPVVEKKEEKKVVEEVKKEVVVEVKKDVVVEKKEEKKDVQVESTSTPTFKSLISNKVIADNIFKQVKLIYEGLGELTMDGRTLRHQSLRNLVNYGCTKWFKEEYDRAHKESVMLVNKVPYQIPYQELFDKAFETGQLEIAKYIVTNHPDTNGTDYSKTGITVNSRFTRAILTAGNFEAFTFFTTTPSFEFALEINPENTDYLYEHFYAAAEGDSLDIVKHVVKILAPALDDSTDEGRDLLISAMGTTITQNRPNWRSILDFYINIGSNALIKSFECNQLLSSAVAAGPAGLEAFKYVASITPAESLLTYRLYDPSNLIFANQLEFLQFITKINGQREEEFFNVYHIEAAVGSNTPTTFNYVMDVLKRRPDAGQIEDFSPSFFIFPDLMSVQTIDTMLEVGVPIGRLFFVLLLSAIQNDGSKRARTNINNVYDYLYAKLGDLVDKIHPVPLMDYAVTCCAPDSFDRFVKIATLALELTDKLKVKDEAKKSTGATNEDDEAPVIDNDDDYAASDRARLEADIEFGEIDFSNSFCIAVEGGDVKVVQWMIENVKGHGAQPNPDYYSDEKHLFSHEVDGSWFVVPEGTINLAAIKGDLEMVRLLHANKIGNYKTLADAVSQKQQGNPFCEFDVSVRVHDFLLTESTKKFWNNSAFYATFSGNLPLLKWAFEHPEIDFLETEYWGSGRVDIKRQAVTNAARFSHLDVITYMFDNQLVKRNDELLETIINNAVEHGQVKVVQLIADKYPPPNKALYLNALKSAADISNTFFVSYFDQLLKLTK